MTARILGLCIGAVVIAVPASGCSIMFPGNEGWQCKTSDDCKEGFHCRTYQFKGRDHTRRYCTGRKALTTNKQTYNWFLLVATWVMTLGLPALVVVMVIVGRIRKKKQGAATPGAAAGPPTGPPAGGT